MMFYCRLKVFTVMTCRSGIVQIWMPMYIEFGLECSVARPLDDIMILKVIRGKHSFREDDNILYSPVLLTPEWKKRRPFYRAVR